MPLINSSGDVLPAPEARVVPVDGLEVPDVSESGAVALTFEGPQDGRAFSVCAILRSSGFSGLIVAEGPVGLDRLSYAFSVGFDLVSLDDDDFRRLKPVHLQPFSHSYQTPVGAQLTASGALKQ